MSTICPSDHRACPDDICRGSGQCAVTGTELLDRCARCGGIYSHDYDIDCECEPEDNDGDAEHED